MRCKKSKQEDRQTKQQLKAERRAKVRKSASASDAAKMRHQLAPLGLQVVEVTGDGNCFFRSVADQICGRPEQHARFRQEIMDFVEEHEDDFKWFIEDDEEFEDYIARMRKLTQWGGNLEVYAAARCYGVIWMIHRVGEPRYMVDGTEGKGSRLLHLAYHDGEHYNSVRNAKDDLSGAPIAIDPRPYLGGRAPAKPAASETGDWGQEVEHHVMECTGCWDIDQIRAALASCGGDGDEAIEIVIAGMCGTEDTTTATGDGGAAASSMAAASDDPIDETEAFLLAEALAASQQDETSTGRETTQTDTSSSSVHHAMPALPSLLSLLCGAVCVVSALLLCSLSVLLSVCVYCALSPSCCFCCPNVVPLLNERAGGGVCHGG